MANNESFHENNKILFFFSHVSHTLRGTNEKSSFLRLHHPRGMKSPFEVRKPTPCVLVSTHTDIIKVKKYRRCPSRATFFFIFFLFNFHITWAHNLMEQDYAHGILIKQICIVLCFFSCKTRRSVYSIRQESIHLIDISIKMAEAGLDYKRGGNLFLFKLSLQFLNTHT